MSLDADLSLIATAAEAFQSDLEELVGVVPAEPFPGRRTYLCAYRCEDVIGWLVLDTTGGKVLDRALIKETASIIATCEFAEESAGGGDLPSLRLRLSEIRAEDNPVGIQEAEEAAEELENKISAALRLASPRYLDEIGDAVRKLEQTLGESGSSPFVAAMRQGVGMVGEFVSDVERGYKDKIID
tara:strand:+ start:281 stop:835 length:555 start_codon:yes stop_codon:yes gene_type:complete